MQDTTGRVSPGMCGERSRTCEATTTTRSLKREIEMRLGASPTEAVGPGTTLKQKYCAAVTNLRKGRLHDVWLRRLPAEKRPVGLGLQRLERAVVSDESPLAGGWRITSIPDEGPAARAAQVGQLKLDDIRTHQSGRR